MYELQYLPLAQADLFNIISYISDCLKAPEAAMDLVEALDNAIARLRNFPYSCRVYQPVETLEAEYRVLPVKNYLVFYVVNECKVEIHRIIYAKMNLEQTFK
jgi:toxin ParE1/3/4